MNFSYLLYQAERVKSAGELREADIRAGERAERTARLWRSLLSAWRQSVRYETDEHESIRQSCVTAAR